MRPMASALRARGTRFFWRLCAGFVGLVLVTSLAIGTLIDARVRADLQDSIQSQLHAETAHLAQLTEGVLLGEAPTAPLQRQADAIAAQTGSRLTVLDAEGRLIVNDHANHRGFLLTTALKYVYAFGSRPYARIARDPKRYPPEGYVE